MKVTFPGFNQFHAIFLPFPRGYRKGLTQNWKKIEISRLTARNFKLFFQFFVSPFLYPCGNGAKMAGNWLNHPANKYTLVSIKEITIPAQERVKFSRSRGEASRAGKFYTLECRKKDSRSRGVASRAGIDLTCPTDLAGQPNLRVYIMVKMPRLNWCIELGALLRLKYVRNQVLMSSLHQILNF